jgi:transcription elongation factor Elf1
MSNYIDHKYVSMLSPRLPMFARKDKNLYNFRCPICGDSTKNKTKARGYVYEKKGSLFFRCHNCGSSMSLGNFIKSLDGELYKQYVTERYVSGNSGQRKTKESDATDQFKMKAPNFSKKRTKSSVLVDLPSIDILPTEHFAKQYVVGRGIPEKYHAYLYFADDFAKWVDSKKPGRYTLAKDDPRLVIPYFDENGNMFAAQGRALSTHDSALRYITVKFEEERTKVYGVDRWKKDKLTYVVEGPIDSLFLPNCLAMGGADLSFDELNKDNTIFIFDNERRNKEIIARLEKTIDAGFKVCIFPDNIQEKDINDMISSGRTSSELVDVINKNTYSGLSAKAKLMSWKRI